MSKSTTSHPGKPPFRFSPKEHAAIAADYATGIRGMALCQKWAASNCALYATLRRAGAMVRTPEEASRENVLIQVERQRAFSPSQEIIIVAEYAAGLNTYQLAARHGVHQSTIHRLLQRRGVACRPGGRRLAINESAFDDANESEAAAYFVGLLMADGCVTHGHGKQASVKLSLTEGDGEHVIEYRNFLKSCHKTTLEKGGGFAGRPRIGLAVCSDRLANALAIYGVVPRKSLTAKVRALENNRHFWRGLLCGDGSLWVGRRRTPFLSLAGSRDNMNLFLSFCLRHTSTKTNVRPQGSIWVVNLSGGHAYRVIQVMFTDCSVALPRKWDIARRILEDRRWANVFHSGPQFDRNKSIKS